VYHDGWWHLFAGSKTNLTAGSSDLFSQNSGLLHLKSPTTALDSKVMMFEMQGNWNWLRKIVVRIDKKLTANREAMATNFSLLNSIQASLRAQSAMLAARPPALQGGADKPSSSMVQNGVLAAQPCPAPTMNGNGISPGVMSLDLDDILSPAGAPVWMNDERMVQSAPAWDMEDSQMITAEAKSLKNKKHMKRKKKNSSDMGGAGSAGDMGDFELGTSVEYGRGGDLGEENNYL